MDTDPKQEKRKNNVKKKQVEEDNKKHKADVAEKQHVAREVRATKWSPQKVHRQRLKVSMGTDTFCRA